VCAWRRRWRLKSDGPSCSLVRAGFPPQTRRRYYRASRCGPCRRRWRDCYACNRPCHRASRCCRPARACARRFPRAPPGSGIRFQPSWGGLSACRLAWCFSPGSIHLCRSPFVLLCWYHTRLLCCSAGTIHSYTRAQAPGSTNSNKQYIYLAPVFPH